MLCTVLAIVITPAFHPSDGWHRMASIHRMDGKPARKILVLNIEFREFLRAGFPSSHWMASDGIACHPMDGKPARNYLSLTRQKEILASQKNLLSPLILALNVQNI